MDTRIDDTLERARRHVALGEACVAQQRRLVVALADDGQASREAQRLLDELEETLSRLRAHLLVEERASTGAAPQASHPHDARP